MANLSNSWRRWLVRLSLLGALSALPLASVLSVAGHAQTAQSPGSNGPVPVVNAQTRAADLVEPGVVWVRVDWEAWVVTDFGTFPEAWSVGCSGLVVNPGGYIVTAGHCLDDGWEGAQGDALEFAVDEMIDKRLVSASKREKLIEAVRTGAIRWQIEGNDANTRPDGVVHVQLGGGRVKWRDNVDEAEGLPARVLDFSPWSKGDIGLLKVDNDNLPVVPLAPKSDIQVGQELLSIGYPLALSSARDGDTVALTDRNGQVNSTDSTSANGPGNRFYETSAGLTPGMSGGPSVDLQGRVIGLNSFTSEDRIAYIVPSSLVLEMLNRNGVKNEQGRLDQVYRQGLENYYQGYHTDAIQNFDQVLAMLPKHQQAIDKKARAADLRQRFGDQPKPVSPQPNPTGFDWAVPAGAAALVVIGLSALVGGRLWYRKRARRRQEPTGGGVSHAAGPPAPLPAPATPGAEDTNTMVSIPASTNGHTSGRTDGESTTASSESTSTAMQGAPSATGTRVARDACPNCGKQSDTDANYCPGCGTRLG